MSPRTDLIQGQINAKQARQEAIQAEQDRLDAEALALAEELDRLDEEMDEAEEAEETSSATLTPPVSDKPVEERYRRASVNWGSVAVHPTDLVALYRPLSVERAEFISINRGGQNTRTTAVALALMAAGALEANGYNGEEIATILASAAGV